MPMFNLLGLAGAMFLLAMTPGPGVFATISKALSEGFKQAAAVVVGIVVGDLIFLLLAIYGLAVLAEMLSGLFTVIKYLGGAYLIWLGVKSWRASPTTPGKPGTKSHTGKRGFGGGLAITLGNPKVIFFYLGFLPSFVKLDTLSPVDVAVVAFVVSLVVGSVLLFYAFTASRAKRVFKSDKAQNRMNKTAGGVMIGTGALLVSKT